MKKLILFIFVLCLLLCSCSQSTPAASPSETSTAVTSVAASSRGGYYALWNTGYLPVGCELTYACKQLYCTGSTENDYSFLSVRPEELSADIPPASELLAYGYKEEKLGGISYYIDKSSADKENNIPAQTVVCSFFDGLAVQLIAIDAAAEIADAQLLKDMYEGKIPDGYKTASEIWISWFTRGKLSITAMAGNYDFLNDYYKSYGVIAPSGWQKNTAPNGSEYSFYYKAADDGNVKSSHLKYQSGDHFIYIDANTEGDTSAPQSVFDDVINISTAKATAKAISE